MNLETLVLELVADDSKLSRDIDAAVRKAIKKLAMVEKGSPIKPKVELDNLHELNELLDVKQNHLFETVDLFENNPIAVKVDDSEIEDANKKLNELEAKKKNRDRSGSKSGQGNYGDTLYGEIEDKLTSEVEKVVDKLGDVITAPFAGIGRGFFEGFGQSISKELFNGFASVIGEDFNFDLKDAGKKAANATVSYAFPNVKAKKDELGRVKKYQDKMDSIDSLLSDVSSVASQSKGLSQEKSVINDLKRQSKDIKQNLRNANQTISARGIPSNAEVIAMGNQVNLQVDAIAKLSATLNVVSSQISSKLKQYRESEKLISELSNRLDLAVNSNDYGQVRKIKNDISEQLKVMGDVGDDPVMQGYRDQLIQYQKSAKVDSRLIAKTSENPTMRDYLLHPKTSMKLVTEKGKIAIQDSKDNVLNVLVESAKTAVRGAIGAGNLSYKGLKSVESGVFALDPMGIPDKAKSAIQTTAKVAIPTAAIAGLSQLPGGHQIAQVVMHMVSDAVAKGINPLEVEFLQNVVGVVTKITSVLPARFGAPLAADIIGEIQAVVTNVHQFLTSGGAMIGAGGASLLGGQGMRVIAEKSVQKASQKVEQVLEPSPNQPRFLGQIENAGKVASSKVSRLIEKAQNLDTYLPTLPESQRKLIGEYLPKAANVERANQGDFIPQSVQLPGLKQLKPAEFKQLDPVMQSTVKSDWEAQYKAAQKLKFEFLGKMRGSIEPMERMKGDIGSIAKAFGDLIKRLEEQGKGFGFDVKKYKMDESAFKGITLDANAVEMPDVSKLKRDAGSVGKSIPDGVGSGVNANKNIVFESVESTMTQSIDVAKKAIDSHSPSKKFIKVGEAIGQGLEIGASESLTQAEKKIMQKLSALSNNATKLFTANGSESLNPDTLKAIRRRVVSSSNNKIANNENLKLLSLVSKTNYSNLIRMHPGDANHSLGDKVNFANPKSFTGDLVSVLSGVGLNQGSVNLQKGDSIYRIKNPRKGFDIPYNAIGLADDPDYDYKKEKKSLVSGNYKVTGVSKQTIFVDTKNSVEALTVSIYELEEATDRVFTKLTKKMQLVNSIDVKQIQSQPNQAIEQNWDKTANAVQIDMVEMTETAKKQAYPLQKNLSEGSPGPTHWIRENWKKTASFVNKQIESITANSVKLFTQSKNEAGRMGFDYEKFPIPKLHSVVNNDNEQTQLLSSPLEAPTNATGEKRKRRLDYNINSKPVNVPFYEVAGHKRSRTNKKARQELLQKIDSSDSKEELESIKKEVILTINYLKDIRLKLSKKANGVDTVQIKAIDNEIKNLNTRFNRQFTALGNHAGNLAVEGTEEYFDNFFGTLKSSLIKGLKLKGEAANGLIDQIMTFAVAGATTFAPGLAPAIAAAPLAMPLIPAAMASLGIGTLIAPIVQRIDQALMQQEPIKQRFTTLEGNTTLGGAKQSQVTGIAEKYSIPIEPAVQNFSQMAIAARNTNLTGQEMLDLFEGISASIRALGLSTQDADLIFMAYTQMLSKGKISMEELRQQLGERFPPAMSVFAKALNTTTAGLDEMVSRGAIGTEKWVGAVSKVLKEDFGTAALSMGDNYASATTRIQNLNFKLNKNFADTYGGLFTTVKSTWANVLGLVNSNFKILNTLAVSGLIAVWASIGIGVSYIMKTPAIANIAKGGSNLLFSVFKNTLGTLTPFLIGTIADVMDDVLGAKNSVMENMSKGVGNMFTALFTGIDRGMRDGGMGAMFDPFIERGNPFSAITDGLKSFIKTIPSGVIEMTALVLMFEQVRVLGNMFVMPTLNNLTMALGRWGKAVKDAVINASTMKRTIDDLFGGTLISLSGVTKTDVMSRFGSEFSVLRKELDSSLDTLMQYKQKRESIIRNYQSDYSRATGSTISREKAIADNQQELRQLKQEYQARRESMMGDGNLNPEKDALVRYQAKRDELLNRRTKQMAAQRLAMGTAMIAAEAALAIGVMAFARSDFSNNIEAESNKARNALIGSTDAMKSALKSLGEQAKDTNSKINSIKLPSKGLELSFETIFFGRTEKSFKSDDFILQQREKFKQLITGYERLKKIAKDTKNPLMNFWAELNRPAIMENTKDRIEASKRLGIQDYFPQQVGLPPTMAENQLLDTLIGYEQDYKNIKERLQKDNTLFDVNDLSKPLSNTGLNAVQQIKDIDAKRNQLSDQRTNLGLENTAQARLQIQSIDKDLNNLLKTRKELAKPFIDLDSYSKDLSQYVESATAAIKNSGLPLAAQERANAALEPVKQLADDIKNYFAGQGISDIAKPLEDAWDRVLNKILDVQSQLDRLKSQNTIQTNMTNTQIYKEGGGSMVVNRKSQLVALESYRRDYEITANALRENDLALRKALSISNVGDVSEKRAKIEELRKTVREQSVELSGLASSIAKAEYDLKMDFTIEDYFRTTARQVYDLNRQIEQQAIQDQRSIEDFGLQVAETSRQLRLSNRNLIESYQDLGADFNIQIETVQKSLEDAKGNIELSKLRTQNLSITPGNSNSAARQLNAMVLRFTESLFSNQTNERQIKIDVLNLEKERISRLRQVRQIEEQYIENVREYDSQVRQLNRSYVDLQRGLTDSTNNLRRAFEDLYRTITRNDKSSPESKTLTNALGSKFNYSPNTAIPQANNYGAKSSIIYNQATNQTTINNNNPSLWTDEMALPTQSSKGEVYVGDNGQVVYEPEYDTAKPVRSWEQVTQQLQQFNPSDYAPGDPRIFNGAMNANQNGGYILDQYTNAYGGLVNKASNPYQSQRVQQPKPQQNQWQPQSNQSLEIQSFEPLLRLIRSGEGGYGSFNRGRAGDSSGQNLQSLFKKPIEQITVNQIIAKQNAGQLYAVGAYQFIPSTLKSAAKRTGLENAPFTPETQHLLAIDLIKNKRPQLGNYILSSGRNGSLTEAIQSSAREWASIGLAYPEAGRTTGQSRYAGTGGNRASISPNRAGDAINETIQRRRSLGLQSKLNFGIPEGIELGQTAQLGGLIDSIGNTLEGLMGNKPETLLEFARTFTRNNKDFLPKGTNLADVAVKLANNSYGDERIQKQFNNAAKANGFTVQADTVTVQSNKPVNQTTAKPSNPQTAKPTKPVPAVTAKPQAIDYQPLTAQPFNLSTVKQQSFMNTVNRELNPSQVQLQGFDAGQALPKPVQVNTDPLIQQANRLTALNQQLIQMRMAGIQQDSIEKFAQLIDDVTGFSIQLQRTVIETDRTINDQSLSILQMTRNAKGFLTIMESARQSGIDTFQNYTQQIRSIEDKQREIALFVAEKETLKATKQWAILEGKKLRLNTDLLQSEYDKIGALIDQYDAQSGILETQKQQLLATRDIAAANAFNNAYLEKQLNYLDKAASLMASISGARYDLGGTLVNDGAIIQAKMALDTVQQRALAEAKTLGLTGQAQADFIAQSKELAEINYQKSFREAIPFIQELGANLKEAIFQTNNFTQAFTKLLDVMASQIFDQLVLKPVTNTLSQWTADMFGYSSPNMPTPENGGGFDAGSVFKTATQLGTATLTTDQQNPIVPFTESLNNATDIIPTMTEQMGVGLTAATGALTGFTNTSISMEQSALLQFVNALQIATQSLYQFAMQAGGGGLFGTIADGLTGLFTGGFGAANAASAFIPTSGYTGDTVQLPAFAMGTDEVDILNFAEGIDNVDILNFANGIDAVMAKEKAQTGQQPMLAVVNQGEAILSTLNGDAQKFRALKRTGVWDNIPSFANGTDRLYNDSRNYRGNWGMETMLPSPQTRQAISNQRNQVVNNFTQSYTVVTPNADSFRRSQSQIQDEGARVYRRKMR
jgi:tape measure domain-containing protein